MRIGITCDLKIDGPAPADLPDDFQEEFDSPVTLNAVAGVLRGLGHDVQYLGNGRELLHRLLADPPEFVFNFAEGHGSSRSREARVPAVLEMLDIPYTGSDPLTLAVGLDKECAKKLVHAAGVAIPRGFVLLPNDGGRLRGMLRKQANFPFPCILKPAWEGSSKGIRGKCIVDNLCDLEEEIELRFSEQPQPLLIEEFLTGDELTVGVLGNEPASVLGIMRVLPTRSTERFVYSLEVKRDWHAQVRYECPAKLPAVVTARIREVALTAYRALGCRDVARIDFRLCGETPFFLEANPLPGLNPESSDLIIMARSCGWTYERLITAIFQAALERTQGEAAPNALVRSAVSSVFPY